MSVPLAFTRVAASGSTAKAQTLLLIHGMTSAAVTFMNVTEQLAANPDVPLNVVALDLRGHGRSPDAADVAQYDLKSMASDVNALLGNPELAVAADERVHVLGHSWGSRVALQFANDFPQRVQSVIVEDEFIDMDPRENRPDTKVAHTAEEREANFAKLVERARELEKKWQPVQPSKQAAMAFLDEHMGRAIDIVGADDWSRKVIPNPGNPPLAEGANPDEQPFLVLFKPHVTLLWDAACRVADMNAVWKNTSKEFGFPVHIQKGADDESSDIKPDMQKKLEAEAKELTASGLVRTFTVIPDAGHVVHRMNPDGFLADIFDAVKRAMA